MSRDPLRGPGRKCRRPLVLLALSLISGCGLQTDISNRVGTTTNVPTPAPALRGVGLNGERIDLAALRGHAVVVDFWASWCGPCRAEQPQLNAMAVKYAARGVRFLGVDIRDERAPAQAFEREFSVPYPSLFDPSSTTTGEWNVSAPPTTFVVDANGRIRLTQLGTLAGITASLDSLPRSVP